MFKWIWKFIIAAIEFVYKFYPLKGLERRLLKTAPMIWRLRLVPIIFWSSVLSLIAFGVSFLLKFQGLEFEPFTMGATAILVIAVILWSMKIDQIPFPYMSKLRMVSAFILFSIGFVFLAAPVITILFQESQGYTESERLEDENLIRAEERKIEKWEKEFVDYTYCSLEELYEHKGKINSETDSEYRISYGLSEFELEFFAHEICFEEHGNGFEKIPATSEDIKFVRGITRFACSNSYNKVETCAIFTNGYYSSKNLSELKTGLDKDIKNLQKSFENLLKYIGIVFAVASTVRFLMIVLQMVRRRFPHFMNREKIVSRLRNVFNFISTNKIDIYMLKRLPFLFSLRPVVSFFVFALVCLFFGFLLSLEILGFFSFLFLPILLAAFLSYLVSYQLTVYRKNFHLRVWNTLILIAFIPVFLVGTLYGNFFYFYSWIITLIFVPLSLLGSIGFWRSIESVFLVYIGVSLLLFFMLFFAESMLEIDEDILLLIILALPILFIIFVAWIYKFIQRQMGWFLISTCMLCLPILVFCWALFVEDSVTVYNIIAEEFFISREEGSNIYAHSYSLSLFFSFLDYIVFCLGLLIVVNIVCRPIFSQLDTWKFQPK